MSKASVFRLYDIRGLVDIDFDEAWVYRLGLAVGTFYVQKGIRSMVLGYDCRASSPAYHEALTKGLLETGVDVVSIGMVPSPVLYYAVLCLEKQGGVMITASHNPSPYNGFKIWAGEGTLHGDQIQEIREIMEKGDFASGHGMASTFDVLPSYKEDVVGRFRLKSPMRVVVDGGNGMGGDLCADILEAMGAEVDRLYCEPNGLFPNHHPDPVVLANMQDCIARVMEIGADMGLGLDGDGDRLGLVDAKGRLLFGDELLAIYAEELLQRKPKSIVIGDVKCSSCLFDFVNARGGIGLMWMTGHSLIKAKMRELDAPLAGEMSGHIFFRDNWYGFDDAIYSAARMVALLSDLAEKGEKLENLPDWPKMYTTPEISLACSEETKFLVVKKAQEHFKKLYECSTIDGVRAQFPQGWGLIRASNTQAAIVTRYEAASEEALQAIRDCMEKPLLAWIEEMAKG